MSLTDRIRAIYASPVPVWMRMRIAELKRGAVIIQPGTVPWLPIEDWHETDCVSIDNGEVRIVAILAKQAGTGAFSRLVQGIIDCGLTPVVLEPLEQMQTIMDRWGWIHSETGFGDDHENQWRPPVGWR